MRRRTRCAGIALASAVRAAVLAACVASVAACSGFRAREAPEPEEALRDGLEIAGAALAAGQLEVATRLFRSLAEHFEDAPEPALGFGYTAFQRGDFPGAERHFQDAAERAGERPALRAEALLGAGRAALARDAAAAARYHFEAAREPARNTPMAAWVANGLAVSATILTDFESAENEYARALQLSSGHPRIAANYVRMLVAAGRVEEAARRYAAREASYWAGEDGRTLDQLIGESRPALRFRPGSLAAPPTLSRPSE